MQPWRSIKSCRLQRIYPFVFLCRLPSLFLSFLSSVVLWCLVHVCIYVKIFLPLHVVCKESSLTFWTKQVICSGGKEEQRSSFFLRSWQKDILFFIASQTAVVAAGRKRYFFTGSGWESIHVCAREVWEGKMSVPCSWLRILSRLCRTSPAPWDPNLWALLILKSRVRLLGRRRRAQTTFHQMFHGWSWTDAATVIFTY